MARKLKAAKKPRRAAPSAPPAPVAAASSLANKLLVALDQRTEQLGLINGVLRTIISGAELPDILRVFATNLKTICAFDRASIAIYDERAHSFNVPYMIFQGRVEETHDDPRPFGSTILSKVVETRQPVLRKNLEGETGKYDRDTAFLKKGFKSELLFPLTVAGRVFGTFNLACFEADRLSERHIYLVQDLIPAIAVAVYQHMVVARR